MLHLRTVEAEVKLLFRFRIPVRFEDVPEQFLVGHVQELGIVATGIEHLLSFLLLTKAIMRAFQCARKYYYICLRLQDVLGDDLGSLGHRHVQGEHTHFEQVVGEVICIADAVFRGLDANSLDECVFVHVCIMLELERKGKLCYILLQSTYRARHLTGRSPATHDCALMMLQWRKLERKKQQGGVIPLREPAFLPGPVGISEVLRVGDDRAEHPYSLSRSPLPATKT